MKILVACEESQAVTIELRKLGHEAYSCDIEPCSGGHPEWHVQDDALKYICGYCWIKTQDGVTRTFVYSWDLVISFPPCTDLASSGARWFAEKIADGRQQKSIEFFLNFVDLDCPWAVENPVGIMSTKYRKPNQIVQPWQFKHGETKATCIWHSEDLPDLVPTGMVLGRTPRIHYMSPGPERSKLRSKTYLGIARAMAEQWAGQAAYPRVLTDTDRKEAVNDT